MVYNWLSLQSLLVNYKAVMIKSNLQRIRPVLLLILIFGVALGVRAVAAAHNTMIANDETVYVRMAENLAAGKAPVEISGMSSATFTPLLPLFIDGLSRVIKNFVESSHVIVVLFGALLVLPVYRLGRQLLSERTGLMAAALIAISPLLITFSSHVYSEAVYCFFLLTALSFGWDTIQKHRLSAAAITGISLGFAYLANATTVYYLIVLATIILVGAYKGNSWRSSSKALVIMLAIFSVFAIPYVLFLHQELGKWTFTGKDIYSNLRTINLQWNTSEGYINGALQLTDDGTNVKILQFNDEALHSSVIVYLLDHPVQALRQFISNYQIFYLSDLQKVFFGGFLPLMGLGLFGRTWDRRYAARAGYVLVMMLPALLVMLLWQQGPRYYVPFVPFAIILAAEGWQVLERWGRDSVSRILSTEKSDRWNKLVPWAVGVMIIIPTLPFVNTAIKNDAYQSSYKLAGEWIKHDGGPGKKVMEIEYSAAYYSGGDALILPSADYNRTTAYARLANDDYLVITKQDLDQWRPDLSRLLRDETEHPEWKLVDKEDYGPGDTAFVFKLQR